MKFKLNNKGKCWKLVKILIIFLALAVPLLIAHEYIHVLAIHLQGFKAEVHWNIFLPKVSFVNTEGITYTQLFITAISPYILDIVLLTIFYFYRKNKTIKILSWVPFLHIIWNFFMFFIGIIFNKPNDFIVMFVTGNGVFAISLVLIADFLWWKIVREK